MSNTVPVSVIIPTWNRSETLLETLRRIDACSPRPAEIIVHIDHGDWETEPLLQERFSHARVLKSPAQVGPGGGRNKLVASARHEIIASLDDDSYPVDSDYFARIVKLFEMFPGASVLASAIYHRGEEMEDARPAIGSTVHFIGCGVAYRRSAYLAAGGYVPLPVAYGMEEVDLALRLHARGCGIYQSPWLRVFHDTWLSHHASARITCASINNLALLAFLRYPVGMWPYGALQVVNRVAWLVRAGRFRGIISGVLSIPFHLWKYRSFRGEVPEDQLRSFLEFRKEEPRLEQIPERQRALS